MTPYYQDDSYTIYHGDCLEILPTLGKVDLCITDPPYDLSDSPPGDSHYGMSLRKFESSAYTSLTNGFNVDAVFSMCASILPKFNLFCFCSNKQISEIMAWGQSKKFSSTLLVWHKPNSAPFANGVWRRDAEFCVHIRQSKAVFRGNAEEKRKVVSLPCVSNQVHPTEKPLGLVLKYVSIGSDLDQTILDPFMGSGTTLVAAKQLGRKAIGVEICEAYCEIAARRLQQEYLPLIMPEQPKLEQPVLI